MMAINPASWGVLGNPTKEKINEYQSMPFGNFKNLVTRLSRGKNKKKMQEFPVYITKKNITATRGQLTVSAFDWTEALNAVRVREEEIKWDTEPYKENYSEVVYHSMDPVKFKD